MIARWIWSRATAHAASQSAVAWTSGRNGFDSAVTWPRPSSVDVNVCSSRSSHSAVLSMSCIAREMPMSTSTLASSISSSPPLLRGSPAQVSRCSSSSRVTCARSESTNVFS